MSSPLASGPLGRPVPPAPVGPPQEGPAGAADQDLLRTRLELACQATGLGLWDWDLATDALVWDERSRGMYAMDEAGRTGTIHDIDARIHPDDLGGVQRVLQEAMPGTGPAGDVVDVEFRVVWPDGAVRWLYARGQVLRDASGQPVRLIGTNLDVTDRRRTSEQRELDAQRMAAMVDVAHALGEAQDEEQVLEVVTARGAALLGASGVVLCLDDPPRAQVRALTSGHFDRSVSAEVALLPRGFPLPMVHAATTGTEHFYGDRAAAVAAFPGGAELYAAARTDASAAVPLRSGGRVLGSLSLAFSGAFAWREAERALLGAFAAMTAQALERIRAREVEREAATAVRRLAEALQRSLLADPPRSTALQVAVRYAPAAHEAQVGGDWYDAFTLPGGSTALVVGDVEGHDRQAAAGMGQARNMLRALAHALRRPPSVVLAALDEALCDLVPGLLATAVLVRVDPAPALADGGPAGGTDGAALTWSSAGHLPPLVVRPDGRARLLQLDPDLLVGVDPATERSDHHDELAPGELLLLYTDGLVERRGATLQEGLDSLVARAGRWVRDHPGTGPEDLCDALLGQLSGPVEDDTALLAVRVAPSAAAAPRRGGSGRAGAGAREVAEDLPADASSAARARAVVVAHCRQVAVAAGLRDTAELVVSELVTNAVLHGRSGARLVVRSTPALLQLEVSDDDSRLPVLRSVDDAALGGRGLAVVDALATQWGVREGDGGKTVWVDLAR